MKKIRTLVALAAAAAPLSLGIGQARAAQTYHIYASGFGFSSALVFAAPPVSCNPLWASSPTNGNSDTVVVDVSRYAGGAGVPMTWSAVTDVAQHTGGGLSVVYYTASCTTNIATNQSFGLATGGTSLHVPAGAKWAVFEATNLFNVAITF